MATITEQPIRWLETEDADWQRHNTAADCGLQLDANGEYSAHLITLSHIRHRGEDVICVFVGGDVDVPIYWHWSVHAVVRFDDPTYDGYDYGDLLGALRKIGYAPDSDIVTAVVRELQEMVHAATDK